MIHKFVRIDFEKYSENNFWERHEIVRHVCTEEVKYAELFKILKIWRIGLRGSTAFHGLGDTCSKIALPRCIHADHRSQLDLGRAGGVVRNLRKPMSAASPGIHSIISSGLQSYHRRGPLDGSSKPFRSRFSSVSTPIVASTST